MRAEEEAVEIEEVALMSGGLVGREIDEVMTGLDETRRVFDLFVFLFFEGGSGLRRIEGEQ